MVLRAHAIDLTKTILLVQPKAQVPQAGAPVWDFGWHYNVWSKGRHRKKIDAFVQSGVAHVFRDNNQDNVPGNSGRSHPETGRGLIFILLHIILLAHPILSELGQQAVLL